MVVLNNYSSARPAAPTAAGPATATAGARWPARLGRGLGVVLMAFAVLAVLVLIVVPRATGSQSYSVLTSSMAPKYSPGTFLVVQPAPFEELKLGDVITYQITSGQPGVITHRIVGFGFLQSGEKTLTLKGDNNGVADPEPVREIQVRGKLLYAVPYVGYLANALGNSDRSLWMVGGAIALIAYGGITMVRGTRTTNDSTSRKGKTA